MPRKPTMLLHREYKTVKVLAYRVASTGRNIANLTHCDAKEIARDLF